MCPRKGSMRGGETASKPVEMFTDAGVEVVSKAVLQSPNDATALNLLTAAFEEIYGRRGPSSKAAEGGLTSTQPLHCNTLLDQAIWFYCLSRGDGGYHAERKRTEGPGLLVMKALLQLIESKKIMSGITITLNKQKKFVGWYAPDNPPFSSLFPIVACAASSLPSSEEGDGEEGLSYSQDPIFKALPGIFESGTLRAWGAALPNIDSVSAYGSDEALAAGLQALIAYLTKGVPKWNKSIISLLGDIMCGVSLEKAIDADYVYSPETSWLPTFPTKKMKSGGGGGKEDERSRSLFIKFWPLEVGKVTLKKVGPADGKPITSPSTSSTVSSSSAAAAVGRRGTAPTTRIDSFNDDDITSRLPHPLARLVFSHLIERMMDDAVAGLNSADEKAKRWWVSAHFVQRVAKQLQKALPKRAYAAFSVEILKQVIRKWLPKYIPQFSKDLLEYSALSKSLNNSDISEFGDVEKHPALRPLHPILKTIFMIDNNIRKELYFLIDESLLYAFGKKFGSGLDINDTAFDDNAFATNGHGMARRVSQFCASVLVSVLYTIYANCAGVGIRQGLALTCSRSFGAGIAKLGDQKTAALANLELFRYVGLRFLLGAHREEGGGLEKKNSGMFVLERRRRKRARMERWGIGWRSSLRKLLTTPNKFGIEGNSKKRANEDQFASIGSESSHGGITVTDDWKPILDRCKQHMATTIVASAKMEE
eukprot:jgi/Bigna1/134475/aug1.25_g9183